MPTNQTESAPQAGTEASQQAPQQPSAGSTGNAFLDSLPAELRSAATLQKFKDVAGLAKSYVELERHLGGTLKLPGPNATKAELDAFYNRLGRPETPEGYGIKAPQTLPPGVTWNEEFAKAFADLAHKNGLTKTQAAAMVEFWQNMAAEQAKSFWTREKGLAALETKLGSQENVSTFLGHVHRGMRELADDDFRELLDSTGLGNHPVMLGFLERLGRLFDEDALPENFEAGATGLHPEEAKRRIAQIRNDRTHPYHRGDPAAVAEMNKLYEAAMGRRVVLELPGVT